MECLDRRWVVLIGSVSLALSAIAQMESPLPATDPSNISTDVAAQSGGLESWDVPAVARGPARIPLEEALGAVQLDPSFDDGLLGFSEASQGQWQSVNSLSNLLIHVTARQVQVAVKPANDRRAGSCVVIDSNNGPSRGPFSYDTSRKELVHSVHDGWTRSVVNSPAKLELRYASSRRHILMPGEPILNLQLKCDFRLVTAAKQRELVLSQDGVLLGRFGLQIEGAPNAAGEAIFLGDFSKQNEIYEVSLAWQGAQAVLPSMGRLVITFTMVYGGAERVHGYEGRLDSEDWRAANFGSSTLRVATAGDVNGDGFSDVLVGAPEFNNGLGRRRGRVYLYYGGPDGPGSQPDWVGRAHAYGTRFGLTVAPAGDIDGDGFDEFLVGAPGGDNSWGAAYLYQGGPRGPESAGRSTVHPSITEGELGRSLGYAGDVNADGFDDFFVGAPTYDFDLQPQNKGALFVWHGRADWFTSASRRDVATADADWHVNGSEPAGHLGTSVSTAGDLDLDGFVDLIAGAPNSPFTTVRHPDGSTTRPTNIGRTFRWRGGISGLEPGAGSPVFPCCQPHRLYGREVSLVGTLGPNGEPAILEFAPHYVGSTQDAGGVRISVRGEISVLEPQAGSYFSGARTIGDVNGDGYPDFGTSARYTTGHDRVDVHFGGEGANNRRVTLENTVADFATAGDVNGDGFSDTVVVRPSGTVVVYFGVASPIKTMPYWTLTNDSSFTQSESLGFGRSIAARGDFNGDGFTDVAIGAPHTRIVDAVNAGVVSIYYGPMRTRPAKPRQVDLRGPSANNEFGYALACLDFDNDGIDDLAVGAPGWTDGATRSGAVFLFRGSTSGLSNARNATLIKGQGDGARFGHSLAGAGDFDDDGFGDLVVGAPAHSETNPEEGAAYVLLGRVAGEAIAPDWYATSKQPMAHFGWQVAGGRDVNGDGREDIAISAPDVTRYSPQDGAVFVWYGGEPGPVTAGGSTGLGASGTTDLADWESHGNHAHSGFGSDVALVGDLSGDGRSEIAIGAPALIANGVRVGGVTIRYSEDFSRDIPGAQFEGKLGFAVAAAGDLNHDGFADFAAAAPFYDVSDTGNDGRVYVWYGRGTPYESYSAENADLVIDGASNAVLGAAIGGADANADGFDDLLVGAPRASDASGEVHVYSNAPSNLAGSPIYRFVTQSRVDAPYLVGSWDSPDSLQGFRLLNEIRNPFAKLRTTLEYKVARYPAGSLASESVQRFPSFTPPPATSGFAWRAYRNVAGLAPGPHLWMARLDFNNPYLPRSPWLTIASGTRTEPAIVLGASTANAVTAIFNAVTSASGELALQFDATVSTSTHGDLSSFSWDFGDGETSTGATVSHRYAMPGIYEVRLRVADVVGNVGQSSQRVKVLPSDARRLMPIKVAGEVGNSGWTSVYKAGLAAAGLTQIRSLIILDHSASLATSYGKWSGMDIDAIAVLGQDCVTAACAADGARVANLAEGAVLVRGGDQVPPIDGRLAGLVDARGGLDAAAATINAFDAIRSQHGFVSLGNGGVLASNLSTAVLATDTYLYIGEVVDRQEVPNAEIYVSGSPLPVPGVRATVGPEGGSVVGASFVFTVPPNALSAPVDMSFLEQQTPMGQQRVWISPSLQFTAPVQIFLKNTANPVYKLSVTPPALTPSTQVNGGRLLLTRSNSEWGTSGPHTPCPGDRPHCVMQEFTGSDAGLAGCLSGAVAAFTSWLHDQGSAFDSQNDTQGLARAICRYDPVFALNMTATPMSGTTPCRGDPSQLCRSWAVTIPPNRPGIDSYVYLPSSRYLQSLSFCEAEGNVVQTFHDDILAHEMQHVDINNTANVTMDGTNVTVVNVPLSEDANLVKARAYQQACTVDFLPKLRDLHDAFHQLQPEPPLPGSDGCARCGEPAGGGVVSTDQCTQPTYCPCNDPAQGKPRAYASATHCAVQCPSGIKCFAALCIPPPSCH